MKKIFLHKDVTCPVCLTKFKATQVRRSKCIPKGRDTDFRYIYQEINPYLYEIWVCPECHYSASKNIFTKIKNDEINKIAEVLASSNIQVNPNKERTSENAIIFFKLALLCSSYRDLSPLIIGGLCLKTAWIYRELEDPQELQYLQRAINFYEEGFSTERFPFKGMTEMRVAYLIGELYRRLHKYGDSIRWFEKVVMHPKAYEEPAMVKMGRQQWALAKDEYDQAKKKTEINNMSNTGS